MAGRNSLSAIERRVDGFCSELEALEEAKAREGLADWPGELMVVELVGVEPEAAQ